MNILVVGATSAIAEAAARVWAARGDSLYLAARRESLLASNAEDLRVRGARQVASECFDILASGTHEGLLERAEAAIGALDCVLIAHGTLPDQAAAFSDPLLAVREIQVNGVCTVALSLRAAARFEARGSGTLAVITSVAGVRGRASNFVYGSAKALVSTCLAGLRHRMHGKGVAIVDIRPGFVDTPMTAAFPKGGPLWASPAKVAADIVTAIDRRASVVYTPWFWRWIMLVIRHVPEAIFVRTKL
jgi:decaprenylphospho-beta-D-erythro-pentofuranosid-2-ulose 2-reductase